MSAPILSVIIPVYNGSRFLSQALQSVMNQTFRDFECIVVNDGSTDTSMKILQKIARKDPRLKIFSRSNGGLVPSLNDAIRLSQGKYLARMDADDICVPDRFERQVAFMESNPKVVCMGASVEMIDPQGRRLKTYHPPRSHSEIVKELLEGNGGAFIHPTVMIRSDAVAGIGGYRKLFAGYGEDWDLFLRLTQLGEVANLPEILLGYRQHPGSYNHTRSEAQIQSFAEAINQARAAHGKAPLAKCYESSVGAHSSVRRLWALWAMEGGEWNTGLVHAFGAIISSPFDRSCWSVFNYAIRQFFNTPKGGAALT